MTQANTSSNYEAAVKAERAKVVRCFHRYDTDSIALRRASFRMGRVQRDQMGEYFFTHPAFPNVAFPTRKAAVNAALNRDA